MPNFIIIWLYLSANFLFCLSTQIKQCLVLGIFLLKSCSSTVAKSPLKLHFGKSDELSCLNISHCLAWKIVCDVLCPPLFPHLHFLKCGANPKYGLQSKSWHQSHQCNPGPESPTYCSILILFQSWRGTLRPSQDTVPTPKLFLWRQKLSLRSGVQELWRLWAWSPMGAIEEILQKLITASKCNSFPTEHCINTPWTATFSEMYSTHIVPNVQVLSIGDLWKPAPGLSLEGAEHLHIPGRCTLSMKPP